EIGQSNPPAGGKGRAARYGQADLVLLQALHQDVVVFRGVVKKSGIQLALADRGQLIEGGHGRRLDSDLVRAGREFTDTVGDDAVPTGYLDVAETKHAHLAAADELNVPSDLLDVRQQTPG